MAEYDFSKGMYSRKNKDSFTGLSDYESGKYVYFDKKNLFTFGNGDSQIEYQREGTLNNIHLGQLKLLLSEMQTIIYYMDTTLIKTVVYVGAAHGYHIYVLNKLFPTLQFHLYDISDKWDKRLYKEENIIIYNRYFDEKDVKKWKESKEEILFISDIRNLEVGLEEDKKINLTAFETMVREDMIIQKEWVEQIKPSLSLLKFKLQYPNEEKKKEAYLDGTVFRQIFPRQSSCETRLLVSALAYRDWDLRSYERMNAYHNRVIRPKALFFNPIDGSKNPIYNKKGLTNDFESTAFTIVVIDYLKKINMKVTETNIKKILDFILDNTYDDRKINLRAERRL